MFYSSATMVISLMLPLPLIPVVLRPNLFFRALQITSPANIFVLIRNRQWQSPSFNQTFPQVRPLTNHPCLRPSTQICLRSWNN